STAATSPSQRLRPHLPAIDTGDKDVRQGVTGVGLRKSRDGGAGFRVGARAEGDERAVAVADGEARTRTAAAISPKLPRMASARRCSAALMAGATVRPRGASP